MAPVTSKAPSKGASRAWEALTPSLAEWILDAISSMGFEKMTPVQASTIPLFMGNKDVVVEAVTGSGKTLSFLIPLVQRLLRAEEPTKKHHIAAIIVSPTRELATQIHTVLQSLLAFHEPSAAALNPPDEDPDNPDPNDGLPRYVASTVPRVIPQLLLGGTTTPAQDLSTFMRTSPNLLIATPGRLNELLASPHVHIPQSSFDVLVLDEADRLLDLGFSEDLSKIIKRLPKQRRTGLFSASVSEAVDQLIRVGLRNPVRISVKVKGTSGALDQRTPASLTMAYMVTPAHHKLPALAKLIRTVQPAPQKVIVYLSTCAAVDYFQHVLPAILKNLARVPIVVPLHGKHPPNVRNKNFARFATATTQALLLTTDLAARGLDIPSVDLVVQLDPPSDPKAFLHRCGRAGRAGRKGLAVVMLTPGREEDYIPFLSVRKTPVAPLAEPGALIAGSDLSVTVTEADQAAANMRKIVLTDRGIHDKSQKAFVSWVRAYSKHVASSIFRIKDVDWDELAKGWGLLRMPRMPELKVSGWKGDPLLGLDTDWRNYAYKDKLREKDRIEKRDSAAEEENESKPESAKRKVPEAWSEKKEQKETREMRREKRHKKRERELDAKMSDTQRTDKHALDAMIAQVRQQHIANSADDFDGFSD